MKDKETETPRTEQLKIQLRLEQADAHSILLAYERLELGLNRALDALESVLNSASPHPEENPTMFQTWKLARALLREAGRGK